MLKKFFVLCITVMLVLCSFAACQKTGDSTTDIGGLQNSGQASEDKGNENGQDTASNGNSEDASSGTDGSTSQSPEVEFPDVPLA